MQQEIKTLLVSHGLSQAGFQLASKTKIPQQLKALNPQGQTAFRDALLTGSQLLLNLAKLFEACSMENIWNVVHVIFTDGQDECSRASLEDVLAILLRVGQEVNVKTLKIIIFDVGATPIAQLSLKVMASLGGQNMEYYSVHEADFNSIFNHISVSLGLQKRQEVMGIVSNEVTIMAMRESIQPVLQISSQRYAVLLNIDVSQSMKGLKWQYACSGVKKLVDFLTGETDLISALIFNEKTMSLSELYKAMGQRRQLAIKQEESSIRSSSMRSSYNEDKKSISSEISHHKVAIKQEESSIRSSSMRSSYNEDKKSISSEISHHKVAIKQEESSIRSSSMRSSYNEDKKSISSEISHHKVIEVQKPQKRKIQREQHEDLPKDSLCTMNCKANCIIM